MEYNYSLNLKPLYPMPYPCILIFQSTHNQLTTLSSSFPVRLSGECATKEEETGKIKDVSVEKMNVVIPGK